MNEANISFLSRISIAVGTFFAVLGDGGLAARVHALREGEPAPVPARVPVPTPVPVETPARANTEAPALKTVNADAALQLLGLLQRDARFIDFIEEDIAGYADAEIGAAARLVHDGCRTTLREHFTIRPVRDEAEGTRLTLAEGFDASAIRLTGNVVGEAPFTGNLSHRGWRVGEVRLPMLTPTHDTSVIAPAEVEL